MNAKDEEIDNIDIMQSIKGASSTRSYGSEVN